MPKDPNELGALWSKQSPRGEYLSGTIDGVGAVVCFRNDKATAENKQPYWRVMRSKPKDEPRHVRDEDVAF